MLALAPGLDRLIGGSRKHNAMRRSLEDCVTFAVTPRTMCGDPIQGQRNLLHAQDLDRFRPRPQAEERVIVRLERLGFEIVHRGDFATCVRGPAALVSDLMKIELGIQARPRRTQLRATQNFSMSYEPPDPTDLYVSPTESLSIRSTVADIDHFVFMPPPHHFTVPSPVEPSHGYFGIDKMAIRRLLNVPKPPLGAGTRVALVDTGFFPHPFYLANQFDYQPMSTPSIPDPRIDIQGHGTAMAYNTFAVAPRTTVMGFKRIDAAAHIALEEAARADADVISCSWGWRDEQRWSFVEATINSITNRGKIVLFAAGDGARAWPASMPSVLAIGGVYADQQNALEASNHASGFVSSHADYGQRRVPDVCGLCGQRPAGIYIMLPCPPGSEFDQTFSGPSFPKQDGTAANDGWFCASGTSSATAQIAGVAALMVEQARARGRPPLTAGRIKQLLQQSAIPVQRGKNAQGVAAIGHPNNAVGFGLVNAAAAIALV